jgi:hypothetical protein
VRAEVVVVRTEAANALVSLGQWLLAPTRLFGGHVQVHWRVRADTTTFRAGGVIVAEASPRTPVARNAP